MHALLPFLPHPASLGFLDLQGNESMIGVIAVAMSMAIPIVAIVVTYNHKRHKEQLWHDTARLAIEKGQPIPPRPLGAEEMKSPPPPVGADPAAWDRRNQANRRRRDIRTGLILVAVGLAVGFSHFGGNRESGAHSFFAYVPFFIGLAFLLNGLIDGLFFRNSGDSGDRPPQS